MLTIIQVGHNDASDRYIRNKMKAIETEGMSAELVSLPVEATTDDVIAKIRLATHERYCNAIMVQLPLPEHIDKRKVLSAIPPWLDIDGLNPKSNYKPLTPCAVIRWLEEEGVDLVGKRVTILGRSELVGKPLAMMMIDAGAMVTVCNSRTDERTRQVACLMADIVVTATGTPDTIRSDYVKIQGTQIFIDVSINRGKDGKLCGDISEPAKRLIEKVGSRYTPVPGGVGKWTVKELLIRLREMERRSER